jgi:hypothetical protein
MARTFAAFVLALTAMVPSAHAGEGRGADAVAPTAAVAKAWKQEAKPSSAAVRGLFVSYGVMQGLDMASTIKARNAGAVEANPVMQGSYARGMAMKAALGAATMVAVRSMEKKHKAAAIMTMIAANVATAAVVAHNMQVSARQGR